MKKILLLVAMTMAFTLANAQDKEVEQSKQSFEQVSNMEQMATHMADRLKKGCDLTDEQYAQVLELYKAQTAEMQKMFQNRQPGQHFNREEMKKLREDVDAKMAQILTEKQLDKYKEMQKQMPRRGFGGHHGKGKHHTAPQGN
mgnify:CR=1 FL=1